MSKAGIFNKKVKMEGPWNDTVNQLLEYASKNLVNNIKEVSPNISMSHIHFANMIKQVIKETALAVWENARDEYSEKYENEFWRSPGFKTKTTTINIPKEQIDKMIEDYFKHHSFENAIKKFMKDNGYEDIKLRFEKAAKEWPYGNK